jgi:hypothetical protein
MRPRLRGALIGHLPHRRRATAPHEIVLEAEPAGDRVEAGAHRVIRHRNEPRRNSQSAAEVDGDGGETFTGGEPARARDVDGKIAVAELEPGLAAELG